MSGPGPAFDKCPGRAGRPGSLGIAGRGSLISLGAAGRGAQVRDKSCEDEAKEGVGGTSRLLVATKPGDKKWRSGWTGLGGTVTVAVASRTCAPASGVKASERRFALPADPPPQRVGRQRPAPLRSSAEDPPPQCVQEQRPSLPRAPARGPPLRRVERCRVTVGKASASQGICRVKPAWDMLYGEAELLDLIERVYLPKLVNRIPVAVRLLHDRDGERDRRPGKALGE